MKLTISNSTRLLKSALLSFILGLTLVTSGCTDQANDDDKQAQTEQSEDNKNTDEKADAKNSDDKVSDKNAKKEEKQPVPVEVVSVRRGEIQQTYRTITTLEAEQNAQVVARSTGLLQTIRVEEGDTVKKGELLAQLDVEQLALEVAQLEATSNKLAKELERQEALFNRKLGSTDALDRAKFEYQSQLAQFKLAKLKLQYASITAPIDGVVTERLVKTGNLIRENDILFTIINPQSLKAVMHLPEKELNSVKVGQPVLLDVDALNNKIIVGQIERIRPAIDTETGTFKVTAALDNSSNQLKSGMFGKVEVVFEVHTDSLLLEQQALITQDNRSHVFVAKNNKAIQTPVKTGFRQNGVVEIIEGLSDSDQVITTGQQILKHDSDIEIVGQEEQVVETSATQSPANVAVNP
jgi:membrane fusion protein, multidrug efflux system